MAVTAMRSVKITLHVHHTFLHIFQPSLHDCNVKLPNFTHLCMFSLFFLNLDTVLSSSNWIRSTKVETVQTHFLSDIFSLLSSRSFATMTRWFNIILLSTNDNGQLQWPLFWNANVLGKKTLDCVREKHLSYAFYAFIWVKTLVVLHCLVLIACLINWCAVLNSRCFIFLFSVDLFWIMFHPLIPRTNKRWVLLLWFI